MSQPDFLTTVNLFFIIAISCNLILYLMILSLFLAISFIVIVTLYIQMRVHIATSTLFLGIAHLKFVIHYCGFYLAMLLYILQFCLYYNYCDFIDYKYDLISPSVYSVTQCEFIFHNCNFVSRKSDFIFQSVTMWCDIYLTIVNLYLIIGTFALAM